MTTTIEVRIMARLREPLPELGLAAGCEVVISMPGRPDEATVTLDLLQHILVAGDVLGAPINPETLIDAQPWSATYAVLPAGGGEE